YHIFPGTHPSPFQHNPQTQEIDTLNSSIRHIQSDQAVCAKSPGEPSANFHLLPQPDYFPCKTYPGKSTAENVPLYNAHLEYPKSASMSFHHRHYRQRHPFPYLGNAHHTVPYRSNYLPETSSRPYPHHAQSPQALSLHAPQRLARNRCNPDIHVSAPGTSSYNIPHQSDVQGGAGSLFPVRIPQVP